MRKEIHPFFTVMFFGTMFLLYLPLGYLILQAFMKSPNDLRSGLTLEWIVKLFQSQSLWLPLLTSLRIGILAATLSVVIGTLGAMGLARVKGNLPVSMQTLIVLPILLPEVITGLSLLLFFLLCKIPLGFTTVVLAHASFSASFVFFVMNEQFRKLDPALEEAAQDLGATPFSAFWNVTFPNIMPGIMGSWLLAFTISFDDFLISYFTSGAGVTTLPLKIYSMMRVGLTPELNALSFFMIVMSTSLVLILLSKEDSQKWVLKSS